MTGALDIGFIVPGRLSTPTGGFIYDKTIIEGLRAAGDRVTVIELPGDYPFPDATALKKAEQAFAKLPDGAVTIVDGLAGGALPDTIARHGKRLCLVALVHHPLWKETGLNNCDKKLLFNSEKQFLDAARAAIATSPTTARSLVAEFGVSDARLATAPPGTDPAGASRGSAARGGPVTMICVASLIPRKGHLELLEALARLDASDWRLVCPGSVELAASHAESVLAAASAHPRAGWIDFPGAVSRAALDRYYDNADIFVLPSYYEGFGMVLTEAIARGLPVVSTNGGAIPKTVPEEARILVPPGDIAALKDALDILLSDADRRAALRDGALRARGSLPDWPEAVMRFRGALMKLVR